MGSEPPAGATAFTRELVAGVEAEVEELDALIERATADARGAGSTGGAVTPAVLARLVELSAGRTLEANIGLIIANARSAALLAVALARIGHRAQGVS